MTLSDEARKPARAALADRPAFALRLGPIDLGGRAILAPMAGVTDLGMRRLAARYGASMTVTEMVAGEHLLKGDAASLRRAERDPDQPHVTQIAGCCPQTLAETARYAEANGAVVIDINMGCPAKKVTGGLAGSALMRDLDAATRLIAATVKAVSVPVTVKMRLGWDDDTRNAHELARRAEGEGVRLVTVHGRTRQQFYRGQADWSAVASVKRTVGIPVVVNGDCGSPEDARRMLAASGADAVMIGRGALGQPWFVGQVAHFLRTGQVAAPPPLRERRDAALLHYEILLDRFGIDKGLRHARKHLCAYADRLAASHPGAGAARACLASSDSVAEVKSRLRSMYDVAEELEAAA